jgi:Holliday junction resolvase
MLRPHTESRTSLRSTAVAYIGQLGEKAAMIRLSEEGFEVRRFRDVLLGAELSRRGRSGFKVFGGGLYGQFRRDADKFLGRQLAVFLEYSEPILDASKAAAEKRTAKIEREMGTHFDRDVDSLSSIAHFDLPVDPLTGVAAGSGPDLVARKNGKIYIVEVKTNRGVLERRRRTGYQGALLARARRFGFIPLLVKPKVVLKIPLEQITIQEL